MSNKATLHNLLFTIIIHLVGSPILPLIHSPRLLSCNTWLSQASAALSHRTELVECIVECVEACSLIPFITQKTHPQSNKIEADYLSSRQPELPVYCLLTQSQGQALFLSSK